MIYEKSNCERFINIAYKKAKITILKVQTYIYITYFGGIFQPNCFQIDKFR